MKFFRVLLFILFIGYQAASAREIMFGDSVTVSLITCGPGKALYSKFGHTAIRIRDTKGLDLVYNYGIFDFRTEHFYLKFIKGYTDYLLGIYPTMAFLPEYRERNSSVLEQVLNLNRNEKKRLIDLLNVNYEPQNRMYRYNFVYDNCATRPKDKIQEALDGLIVSDFEPEEETYRQMIDKYLVGAPWAEFGINLIFGSEADQNVNGSGLYFLPENLKDYFQKADIISFGENKTNRKLIDEVHVLVDPVSEPEKHASWITNPFTVTLLWLLLGLAMTFMKTKRSVTSKLFDSVLFFVTGLAGVIISFFMIFSVHPLVGSNWNLLWLNPLNIIVAFLIWFHKPDKLLLFYHALNILLILIYVLVVAFFMHSIVFAGVPVMLLLLIRSYRRIKRLLSRLAPVTPEGIKWRN